MATGTDVHTHVINLPNDVTRLRQATERAARVGLSPRVFVARTPADLDSETTVDPELAPGEIGCFMSHRALLQEIATQPSDSLHLVLEDDVVFFPGFIESFQRVLEELAHCDAGIVQVGWLPVAAEDTSIRLLQQRLRASRLVRIPAHAMRKSVPKIPPMLQETTPGWGTHCYLVSPAAADRFATFLGRTVLAPVDYYLRAFSMLGPRTVFRTRFPLAGQDWSHASTVRDDRFNHGQRQIDQRGRLTSPHG